MLNSLRAIFLAASESGVFSIKSSRSKLLKVVLRSAKKLASFGLIANPLSQHSNDSRYFFR
ncbi:hypothetical protein [Candidatus Tisiphia endosymbiont of Micropterix aruncella]|uniref:hypothetical protein n=1 Tax=Candidatus Tisiphia endosymbiont of Micropterix aruncella TaxID=3066271 RepID=UPI003AA987CB